MRILFLSPSNTELDQLQTVGKGMLHAPADDPVQNLKNKIIESIDTLDENVIANIPAMDKKPMVRYAICDLPFSLMAVDNDMVVTLYGTEAEGDDQPTFLIKGKKTEAYLSFKAEFERIWSDYSKVSPYPDPLITAYKKAWQDNIKLRDYAVTPAPPKQAILFPTYRCSKFCSYCMFRESRTNSALDDMKPQVFEKILSELIEFGVRSFEISGGGEPLEHADIGAILSILDAFRNQFSDIKFGLLTNGSRLGEQDPSHLLHIFNDYIRVSRYERTESAGKEKELAAWKEGVKKLLFVKRNDPSVTTKIGLKYLLRPANADRFVEMVKTDLADSSLAEIDYLRFRSERRVDRETVARIEQQIYYVIGSSRLSMSSGIVSLALTNFAYPRNFRCWLSPVNVVIAPDGEVYLCCNFLSDPGRKCIGNIGEKSPNTFASIWRSEHHRQLRQNLRRINCGIADYSNCRFAETQEILDRISLTAGS